MRPIKLYCPPFGDLPVEWDGNRFDDEKRLRANCERLQALWPLVWPSIYEAFWNVVKEYGHQEYVGPAMKQLIVRMPELEESDEVEWSISIHTDPFAGVYEIEMQGKTVLDVEASF